MSVHFHRMCVVLLLVIIWPRLFAQSPSRLHTDNVNSWLMYFGNHKISESWGIHAEVQLRRHNILSDPQQLLIRGGLEYYLNNGNRITVGYGFIKTHPYGEFAVANDFPEHRIWQQFITWQSFNKFKLLHRYRLEQRFIGSAATGKMNGGRYENRIRYLLKVTHPLTDSWKRNLFLSAYDELFVNFGKEVGYNLFDQNRAYVALGADIRPRLKVELGYLYQLVQLRNLDTTLSPRNRIENNHTLQAGFFYSSRSFGQRRTRSTRHAIASSLPSRWPDEGRSATSL